MVNSTTNHRLLTTDQNMDRRKIIKQGKGTLTISLPSKWIKQLNLKSRDELFVEQKGLQLIISPSIQQEKGKTTELDLKELSKGIALTLINNLYIKGDDEIKIKFYTKEQYQIIQESTRQLIGFEIVEQTGNVCVLKELAKGESEDFETIVRRIFLLILGMAEEGLISLKKQDFKDLEIIQQRDKSVNTLINYSLRVLNKKGYGDVKKAMHLYALLNFLEQLGDDYSRMYRDIKKISNSTIRIAERSAKMMRTFYEIYYSFDILKANNLKIERNKLREEIDNLLTKTKNKNDLLALYHLRRIADLIIDILKFNLAMQV